MTLLLHSLSHPRLMFWLMPLLMALLVGGTLAQVELGLYEAERRYFASWLIWLGPVPLPGMYVLLGVLSVSLLAKLALKSPWSAAQSGNIITHLGALLLMLGGLLTALSSQEGFLAIAEGETGRLVQDYHQRELALLEDGKARVRYGWDELQAGKVITSTIHPPFTIEKLYRNAVPTWREESGEEEQGIARQLDLRPLPLEKQDEANLAGLVLNVQGKGRYVLFEPMQNRPVLEMSGREYTLALRKAERELPFAVTLLDFDKDMYPATDTAREYRSHVAIDEGDGLSWQAVIRMNEPLRVQGYTLYQSSFVQRDGEQISVLAVVKNTGRVFPYVASGLLALGLVVHLRMRRRSA